MKVIIKYDEHNQTEIFGVKEVNFKSEYIEIKEDEFTRILYFNFRHNTEVKIIK